MENISTPHNAIPAEHRNTLLCRKLPFLLFEAFAAASFLHFSMAENTEGALLSLLSMALYLGIYEFERLLHCRMSTAFYLFALLYASGSLLGDGYKLYYLLRGYDKLLHTAAGVIFAILGSYIPLLFDRKYLHDIWLRAVFALLFSMAVSVLWEFYEFAMDMLLGWDMQNDTVIHSIHSYMLGAEPGVRGSIDTIDSIVVNGKAMEGYIDIGLIDTMLDMLVETLGALVYAVILLLDRDRHPVILWEGSPLRRASLAPEGAVSRRVPGAAAT